MAVYFVSGAPGRNRTGTPAINEAADFKSDVSTNFTTGAKALLCLQVELSGIKKPSKEGFS
jgi:hypothetical protein